MVKVKGSKHKRSLSRKYNELSNPFYSMTEIVKCSEKNDLKPMFSMKRNSQAQHVMIDMQSKIDGENLCILRQPDKICATATSYV